MAPRIAEAPAVVLTSSSHLHDTRSNFEATLSVGLDALRDQLLAAYNASLQTLSSSACAISLERNHDVKCNDNQHEAVHRIISEFGNSKHVVGSADRLGEAPYGGGVSTGSTKFEREGLPQGEPSAKVSPEDNTANSSRPLLEDTNRLTLSAPLVRWSLIIQDALKRPERLRKKHDIEWVFHDTWSIKKAQMDVGGENINSKRISRTYTNPDENINERALRFGDILIDEGSCYQAVVIHPGDSKRLAWGLLAGVLIVSEVIMVPLLFCFNVQAGDDLELQIWSWVKLLYWAVDIPLQFFIGFYKGGVVELRLRQIARSYCSTWFLPDLLIFFFDIGYMLLEYTDLVDLDMGVTAASSRTFRWTRFIKILRVIRFVRLHKLKEIMEIAYDDIRSEDIVLLVKVLQQLSYTLVISHYVACAWFGMSLLQESGSTWVDVSDIRDMPVSDQYIVSLHWSLSQFCFTNSNIIPATPVEHLFSCGVTVCALAAFSAFVSVVTNAGNQMWMIRKGRWNEGLAIKGFIKKRNVSIPLGNRIVHYFNTSRYWERHTAELDIKFFSEIPDTLSVRLHKEIFWPIVNSFPILAKLGTSEPEFCVRLSHLAFSDEFHLPQQDVFVAGGDDVEYVRYLRCGTMMYLCQQSGEANTLCKSSGQSIWLSELALWVKWRYAGVLTSQTAAEMVAMSCEKFRCLARAHAGNAQSYLSRYAFFLVGHLEKETNQELINDEYPLEVDRLMLTERAHDLWKWNQRTQAGYTENARRSG